MTLKHLITADDIKALTVVETGMGPHKLELYIPDVEEDYLEPVLGSALFSELLTFIQTATPDVVDPLAELGQQVQKMLARWVIVEAWPDILVHVSNAGVVVKTGSKDTATSSADIEMTDRSVAKHQERAEKATARLTQWLIQNKDKYPSYVPPVPVKKSTMPVGGIQF